jgi:hypothetical protein
MGTRAERRLPGCEARTKQSASERGTLRRPVRGRTGSLAGTLANIRSGAVVRCDMSTPRWSVLVLVSSLAGCGSSDATAPANAAPGQPVPAPAAASSTPGPGVLLEADATLSEAVSRHQVRVAAGDRVKVTLSSSAFDPVLLVTLPGGQTLTNDDVRGDRTRSELEVIVDSAGELKVTATSYQTGAAGAYHVRVERTAVGASVAQRVASNTSGHHRMLAGGRSLLAGETPAAPGAAAAAPAATPVRVGDRLQANLGAGDTTLPSGELADVYELVVTEPTAITVQMQSRAVDSFLLVTTPSGEQLQNDDSGGTRDAQVELEAMPGTYRIVATSYRAGETGSYELKALSSRDAAAPSAVVAATSGAERVERGELAQGDPQLRSGELFDEHTLTLAVGDAVHLEARSSAFDTYLVVRAPSGEQQDNDDQAPGNLNAGLDFVAREAGAYRVLVTSYRPGEMGPYELVTRGGAPGPADPAAPAPGAAPPAPEAPTPAASGGQSQRGELAQGDRQLQGGELADSFPMTFTPGQPVSIRLESSAFDTYLIVRSPSGRQEDNDDLQPGNLNSGLDIPAAEAGQYTVIVTSYRAGETGPYTLTTGAGGPGGGPARPGTAPAPAAASGSSATRVWAVSVGISDYPGGGNDLPECANDAVKIAEALRNQGLTTPEREVLLTDAQATRGAITQALQRVAREIQPNDVFVFFYSGHGGQADGPSRDEEELDDIDEYMFVYDGQILDDEMGRLIDQVRARTTLFALDSCFSGGFAKDVVTRPGIVGMFSSEEDVTSGVAMQFQAGGYLSHFLRMGIQGEGDSDPRDGSLTVGELTHYVWQQYASQARDVRMQEGYQQLVIDRGAVRNGQVLWARR